MPAIIGPQPPWGRAARLLSRVRPALAGAFAPLRAVRTVAIVGSYATGTPTDASDVDVLVLVGEPEISAYRIWSICVELGMLLDCEVNALIYSTREFGQRLRARDPQVHHMARGALLVKGALPPGAPRRRMRRAPATRNGITPLGRPVSDRKIANLIESSDLLLRDSRHPALSDFGRVGAALEAVRNLVNAVLETQGYRIKGEDSDGLGLQKAQATLRKGPLDQLQERYHCQGQQELWHITPESRDGLLTEAWDFCESARAWLFAKRPVLRPLPGGASTNVSTWAT